MKIFIAYSRKDAELLDDLRSHLSPLERSGRAQVWYDGKIEAGRDWEASIKDALHSADIILLLVSADSISSDYFYGNEVASALERHRSGAARVVPVILRPCAWGDTPLAELQALPKDGVPVTEWRNPDAAWADVASTVSRIVREARGAKVADEQSAAPKPGSTAHETPPLADEARPFWKKPGFVVGAISLVLALFVGIFGLQHYMKAPENNTDTSQPADSAESAPKPVPTDKYKIFMSLADSLWAKSQLDDAADFYDSALVVKPGDATAILNKKRCQDALAGQDKQQRYDNLMREADRLFAQGKFADAKRKYSNAAEIFPAKEDPRKGIENCDKAQKLLDLQQKTTRYKALCTEAERLMAEKKYEEALAKFEEAATIFPREARALKGIKTCKAAIADNSTRPQSDDNSAVVPNPGRDILQKTGGVAKVVVSIRTGDDDLRQNSHAYLIVKLKGQKEWPKIPLNHGQAWRNGSINNAEIKLPQAVTKDEVEYLGIFFEPGKSGFFDTGDNWNMESISISSGSTTFLKANGVNGPLKKFTSNQQSWLKMI